jgi:large subunit ribosomal protein L14e
LREKRRDLSDFDRFRVLILKKQRRYEVRKAAAKAKA